jgi:uncharacterized protein
MTTLKYIKEVLLEEKEEMSKLGINSIGVFGSYVRGEADDDSDIDILIYVSPESSLTFFSLIEI